jgi:hypothetical protein
MLILVCGIFLLFSCEKEEDMRAKTVEELGDPDEIVEGGYGADEYVVYYYYNKQIDRVYVYNKSAPGCGSGGNWYLANTWAVSWDYSLIDNLYLPPTIVHSPVKTAPPATMLTIKATVTDDNYVKDSIMYYRIPGEENFLPITMTLEDSTTFAAEILSERVTAAGIEYYIEASDDGHKSRLPKIRGTYLIEISEGAQLTTGAAQTNTWKIAPKFIPIAREKSGVPL